MFLAFIGDTGLWLSVAADSVSGFEQRRKHQRAEIS